MEKKISLKMKLFDYLEDNPQHLQEIYKKFDDEKRTTIRGRINENVGKCFKRIKKGVYLAEKGEAKALIIEGDAWKEIREIQDESIDTIITDSPYSCLNKQLTMGTTKKKDNKWSFETNDIDNELMNEMYRVLKPGGHFFCFMPTSSQYKPNTSRGYDTMMYNRAFEDLFMECGFTCNRIWIWHKVFFGLGYNGRPSYEQIYFLSKGDRRKPYNLSVPDVLSHKVPRGKRKIHETEKPVELIEDIMKYSNIENDIVLDPFAGGLSVAQAGLNRGVNTINIEIDADTIESSLRKRGIEVTRI